jgi:tryptophan-rich sensory protein
VKSQLGERVFQPNESPHRRAARVRLLALIGFIGLTLLVLAAQVALSAGADWPVGELDAAPFWIALYATLGVAAWLVWRRIDVGVERKRAALRMWGWLLLLSGLWPAAVFGARSPGAGLADMAMMLAMLLLTLRAFLKLQRGAALLLTPYAAWLCWSAYMNASSFYFNGF